MNSCVSSAIVNAPASHALSAPEHRAPVFDEDPAEMGKWAHWVHKLTRAGYDWKREPDR